MGSYFEIWKRPGHPNFGRVIDDPPFREATIHDGVNLKGDGSMQIPNSFDRFDDILKINGASSASSLVRLRSDIDGSVVYEWIPRALTPTSAKNDPYEDLSGRGIKQILEYPKTEAFDWDGTDDWVAKFPDWIWGGTNILTNPGFEDAAPQPLIYYLVIDATAGTFTLEDDINHDVTSPLAWNINDGALEGAIEADLAIIDDISVTPLGGIPTGYQLIISATGGTFTISDGPNTSTPIDWDATAAEIETGIETLSVTYDVTVTDVTIDGEAGFEINLVNPASDELAIDTSNLTDGTAQWTTANTGNGFQLEFVEPPTGVRFNVDDSSLTGTAELVIVQDDELLPAHWTKSQQVSAGTPREFGFYDAFNLTTGQAHSGTHSLRIDPADITGPIARYAGVQQVRSVEEGGLYQASIWVFPTAPGQQYRLVLRGIDEDLVSKPLFAGNISPPANTWSQIALSDITIPDGVQRIIFRFANINQSGNPANFFVDDAELTEGQRATTVGKIIGDLYDHATDFTLRDPIIWDDGSGTDTPYLTLDFTDTLDSNGDPWDDDEVKLYVYMRMSLYQVLVQLADSQGIEFRVVPDDVEAGTWLLQVYNKGGMSTVRDVAIQGGANDVRRLIRRFLPDTDYMVEGQLRVAARAADTALRSALGRMESARLVRELPSESAVQNAAIEDADNAEVSTEPWSYELVDPQDQPLTAYVLGDEIAVHDPPEADGQARLWEVTATFTPEAETWETDLLPEPETSP